MSRIQRQLEEEGEVQGGLLTSLLLNQEMTLEEVYANMTEMLLAGVDTVNLKLWLSPLRFVRETRDLNFSH
ncbi:hypothetical protein scyTo_0025503 [Scyliorhinus torazame]|uniref:Uncharacterized protein n=1 Tax=Scyliorhinus torazame TaxID=75743 RepID=A0A401QHM7_SCYTO|nr:hypothetical protein [Scyliorhinus torazame]